MAQRCGQRFGVIRVFTESAVVRNGFWFGIDYELVRVAAPRFAMESRAPLAEDLFEFLVRHCGKLFDGFDPQNTQSTFGDFANAWNLANGERCEKARLRAWRNPRQPARLGLIRRYLCD